MLDKGNLKTHVCSFFDQKPIPRLEMANWIQPKTKCFGFLLIVKIYFFETMQILFGNQPNQTIM